MDLEKYFDTVNQSKLIQILSEKIEDGRVISLIHKFLQAGVMVDGMFEDSPEGVPQGGPLSPLLGNIMLNECDNELEERGHRFVRYADDLMVFCKSKKAATRTLNNILPYIEGKLFLKVNREKTQVAYVNKVKYLGHSFYVYKGEGRLRVHPKSIQKFKDYNVPMNQDTIFEILSEPDIIKGRKLSGKKVHIKWGEGNLQPNSKRKSCWRFSKKKSRSANLQPSMG